MVDEIDHPAHYGGDTEYEAIKVIEDWGWGYPFCLGNALKYLIRAGRKGGQDDTTDLQKARWYCERATHHPLPPPKTVVKLSPSSAAGAHELTLLAAEALGHLRSHRPDIALRIIDAMLAEG